MVKWRGGEVKRERCRVVSLMKHTFQSAPIAAMC